MLTLQEILKEWGNISLISWSYRWKLYNGFWCCEQILLFQGKQHDRQVCQIDRGTSFCIAKISLILRVFVSN